MTLLNTQAVSHILRSLRVRPYIPARTDMDINGQLVARCVAERGQAPSIIVYCHG